ncbi:uncharacterized protein LOC130673843 [Microplitis mediator]|uniref:uncharacterized protein LOC130673843 n=1 Tax=Microplitis mediator TaxID=375433 RepID=UPI0025573ED8|nr:uncharacterized protein LOC130673843 [Microplitis mediator]
MTSYGAKSDTVYGLVNFSVTPRQFYSVFDKGWINGQIIDAYSTTFMTSWKNITYIPCELTSDVLGDFWKKRRSQKRLIHKIPAELGDIILMPYLLCSHWQLLVVNIQDESVMLYDPFALPLDETYLDAFKKFIGECEKVSSFSKLAKLNWSIKKPPVKRPYQTDDYNCGVYVMHYIECLYKNIPLGKKLDTQDKRLQIMAELLKKSENLRDKCVYCARELLYEKNENTCENCKRSIHLGCLIKDQCDTDDEDESEIARTALKKQKYINLGIFKCRICKRLPELT